ncbi:MAG: rhamnulokinase [Desulfobacterales bacterium]|nr:rhamnulokinase [Desulfobacterales bacterium]
MSTEFHLLAIDIGAESGRAELVTLNETKVGIEEIHRFSNRPVRLHGTLYWDFPFLFAEILSALKICGDRNIFLQGIGVDTWGVDFGLLGPDNQLLSNPVHYRDTRTDAIHSYSDLVMPREKIFSLTGCEPWAISSLFQLLAMQRDTSPILKLADCFLNIPDLINFFLTGIKASERSIVSTSNLMAKDGTWCKEIIDTFTLPDMFCKLVEPGTKIGHLLPEIRVGKSLEDVPVIATCGHDTSAVAAAIPAKGNHWAFLSSGTWSILGMLNKEPITTSNFLDKGFSNDYTLGGWFLCKNIIGLWLVQELCRKWNRPGDPWDYDRMTMEASKAEFSPIVNVADNSLLAPDDMEHALMVLLAHHGQPTVNSKGELVRCILESLALEYAVCLNTLQEAGSHPIESLYIVGGGTANRLLCQLTANACNLPVYAGAAQCTSLGNALVQAKALGIVQGLDDIREIMRNSFDLISYDPQDTSFWKEKKESYIAL